MFDTRHLGHALRSAVVLLLTSVVMACGGGGGGNAAPVTPPPDTVGDPDRPRVIRLDPSREQGGVALDTDIVIEFETPLSITSLQEDHFLLQGAEGPVERFLTLEDGNRVVRLTPRDPLHPSARYVIGVLPGFRDIEGAERQGALLSDFTTQDTTVGASVPLDTGPLSTGVGLLELAEDGTGVAVFEVRTPSVRQLYAQNYRDARPFGSPTLIANTLGFFNLSERSVAVAPGGHASITWRENPSPTTSDIGAAFYDPVLDAWDDVLLESASDLTSIAPQVGVTRAGRSLVMWLEDEAAGGSRIVRVAKRFAPTDTAMTLLDLGAPQASTDLAFVMNASGDGMASWIETDSAGDTRVRVSSIFRADPSLPTFADDRNIGIEQGPQVSVNAQGSYVLAWAEVLPTGESLVLGTAGSVQPLVVPTATTLQVADSLHQLQALGGGEGGLIVWSAATGGGDTRVFAARRQPQGGFGPFEDLTELLPEGNAVGMDADASGNLIVLFAAVSFSEIYTVTWPVDGDPTQPQRILDAVPQLPVVEMLPGGGALVGYVSPVDPTGQIDGAVPSLLRVRGNGTHAPVGPTTAAEQGIFTGRMQLASDALGNVAFLATRFDQAASHLSVISVDLRRP